MAQANNTDDKAKSSLDDWKPGSEPEKAKSVAAAGDFGIPETARSNVDRDYVSRNTKQNDPGSAQPRSGDTEGTRTSGVGGANSGPGSSSGGDVDTTFLGLGSGGSVIASKPADEPPGPDDAQQYREVNADNSSTAAARRDRSPVLPELTEADVMQSPGTSDDPTDQGADGTNSVVREDDSFAGEISRGEASGDDNA